MTIIMSLVVIAIIVLFARAVHKEYSLVPNRKQAFAESVMDFVYDIVQSSIPDERFAKSTFKIATTLFLYIAVANLLGGFVPGISVDVTKTIGANGEIIRNAKFYAF